MINEIRPTALCDDAQTELQQYILEHVLSLSQATTLS